MGESDEFGVGIVIGRRSFVVGFFTERIPGQGYLLYGCDTVKRAGFSAGKGASVQGFKGMEFFLSDGCQETEGRSDRETERAGEWERGGTGVQW